MVDSPNISINLLLNQHEALSVCELNILQERGKQTLTHSLAKSDLDKSILKNWKESG